MGDAIDDHCVGGGLVEVDGAGFDELGVDSGDVPRIDMFHESAGETVFHAKQDANLLHAVILPAERVPRTESVYRSIKLSTQPDIQLLVGFDEWIGQRSG